MGALVENSDIIFGKSIFDTLGNVFGIGIMIYPDNRRVVLYYNQFHYMSAHLFRCGVPNKYNTSDTKSEEKSAIFISFTMHFSGFFFVSERTISNCRVLKK